MRIVFATTRGAGHLGPLVPFARACERAGHDVLAAGPGSAGALARRAGLRFRPVGEPPPEEVTAAWAPVWSYASAPGRAHVIGDLFIGLHARTALPGMLAAIEDFRADLVVRETCEFSSVVAAESLAVPVAQVGIHLSTSTDAGEGLMAFAIPALDALRAEAGLGPDPAGERLRSAPVFTLAPRSLEDADFAEPPRLRRFRDGGGAPQPALPAWEAGTGDPLVYVSFGSEAPRSHWFPDLYRATVDALAALPVRVLVTIGDERDPAELGPLPESVRVERWVPQAAVMPHAAAMVRHGGSGSVLAALAAGVPLAILPLFVDGADNARRVARIGAGTALAGDTAAVADLPGVVSGLLDDPGYRRAAGKVADEIRSLPEVEEAVDALAALAQGERAAVGSR